MSSLIEKMFDTIPKPDDTRQTLGVVDDNLSTFLATLHTRLSNPDGLAAARTTALAVDHFGFVFYIEPALKTRHYKTVTAGLNLRGWDVELSETETGRNEYSTKIALTQRVT